MATPLPPSAVTARRLRDAVWRQSSENEAAACLQDGANPNACVPDGRWLLTVAVDHGSEGLVRVLLEAGADPHALNPDGSTALHHALRHLGEHTPEIVTHLLAAGAHTVAKRSSDGATPFHDFLMCQPVLPIPHSLTGPLQRVFSLLLHHGADPAARDHEGRLAAHHWVERPSDLSRTLLELWARNGGDPLARDANNRTVVDGARQHAGHRDDWRSLTLFLQALGTERQQARPWQPAIGKSRLLMQAPAVASAPKKRRRPWWGRTRHR